MSRPDPRRRPTKAERKEEARLERERIQRAMAKRSRNRKLGVGLMAVAVAGAIGAVAITAAGSPDIPDPDALLRRAGSATQQAGCEPVETIGAYGAIDDPADPGYTDRTHVGGGSFVSMPPLETYPSVPPTSGPHADTTLGAGVYDDPPAVDRVLHSLEHGAAVIWFDPDASSETIDEIRAFYRQNDAVRQDRVIVAPFDYPDQGAAGLFPPGIEMALVAWHRMQTCAEPSVAAAFGFTSQYAFPTYGTRPYQGESPEAERGAAI
jgi:uncharacterized protein DUF3105